ncbi:MAG: penicillin-binding transpeptidase domain-containing protein [Blautia sp.]
MCDNLANSGTCYDLTLLDKITDSTGNTQEEPDPVVHHQPGAPGWTSGSTIHAGMHDVTINNGNGIFADLQTQYNFNAAGKTGTAQQRTDKANHALFIGYAPLRKS